MDGMNKSGSHFDVTSSLSSSAWAAETGKTSTGASVSKAEVTQSLKRSLQPGLNNKALQSYKISHSPDPEVSIADKLADLDKEAPIGDGMFPQEGAAPELPGASTGASIDVDVEAGLSLSAVQRSFAAGRLRPPPEESMDPEQSIYYSLNNKAAYQQVDSKAVDDDILFYSATNRMMMVNMDDLLKKDLEQTVAKHLKSEIDIKIHQTESPKIEQAWSDLNKGLENNDDNAIELALLELTRQYPAISNPIKVADMLKTHIETASSTEEGIADCKQLMKKFQLAGELTVDNLSQLGSLSDDDALQVLMIMRQKAVSSDTPVDELEEAIQEHLIRNHEKKVRELIGLNTDENDPDYQDYKQLHETLGAAPKAGQGAVEGAISRRLLDHVVEKQDDPLSELVKLDTWLADDPNQENVVTSLISRHFSEDLKKKGSALGLFNESESHTESTLHSHQAVEEPVKPGAKKRVRFADQPDVIPKDNYQKAEGEKAEIEDVVELSRDSVSLEIRKYFDRLTDYLQEQREKVLKARRQAYKEGKDIYEDIPEEEKAIIDQIVGYKEKARDYKFQVSLVKSMKEDSGEQGENIEHGLFGEQIKHQRKALLTELDELFSELTGSDVVKARRQKLEGLPFLDDNDGLVDKEEFLKFFEEQLATMVIESFLPRSSESGRKREFSKLEPSETKDPYNPPAKEVNTNNDPTVAPYLVGTSLRKKVPTTNEIMKAVGEASRPYIQAMEINLEDPVSFCADIADVQDPRVMLALKVRIEKNKECPESMKNNWEKRMKDVMCEYQAQQTITRFDALIRQELSKHHKMQAPGIPESEKAYDQDAGQKVLEWRNAMIEHIRKGEMSLAGISSQKNESMQQVWKNMKKPDGMMDDVNKVLAPYMPEPDELLKQLAKDGIVPQVSVEVEQTADPKKPVSEVNSKGSKEPKSETDGSEPAQDTGWLSWLGSGLGGFFKKE